MRGCLRRGAFLSIALALVCGVVLVVGLLATFVVSSEQPGAETPWALAYGVALVVGALAVVVGALLWALSALCSR